MVKRYLYGTIILAVALLSAYPVYSAKPAGNEVMVTMIEGTAQAFAPGTVAGVPLKKGDRLTKDREVKVGEKSRVELRFPDNTVMRLSERTTLKLSEISYDKKTGTKNFKVALAVGKMWANVKKLVTSDSAVEVKTVNAVAGVRGTVYRVNVEEDKSAMVKVYDGSVSVTSPPKEVPKPASQVSGPVPVPGPHEVPPPVREVTMEEWQVIIKSMQQVTISPQGVASQPQDFTPQEDADDWVRWNQERDKRVVF
jgi:hypothetical protein